MPINSLNRSQIIKLCRDIRCERYRLLESQQRQESQKLKDMILDRDRLQGLRKPKPNKFKLPKKKILIQIPS